MKTTTGWDILNTAAEKTPLTRDRIDVSTQVDLQGYIADEFGELFNSQYWPELIPPFLNLPNVANQTFSKNEGSVDPNKPEMGDILTILTRDPRVCDRWTNIDFEEGNGVVFVDTHLSNLYVEYMLPYPGVTFPDMDPDEMSLNAFYAQIFPRRFKHILAHRAAAQLLTASGDAQGAGVQMGLAEKKLATQINRLPPPPEWRRIRTRPGYGRHSHFAGPPVWSGIGA